MKVGDLVKKRSNYNIIGVVVKVEGSHCRVNFGDYGTFWQSPSRIALLS